MSLGLAQKLHVLGQHAVFVLGLRIHLHEAGDQRLQAFSRRQALALDLLHQPFQSTDVALRDLRQQRLLVAHVVVQRGLAHLAGSGHLLHGGRGVALRGKQLGRSGQHLLTLQVIAG